MSAIMKRGASSVIFPIILLAPFLFTAWLAEEGYVDGYLMAALWLMVLGLPIVIGNDLIFYRAWIKNQHTSSPGGLVGGGLVTIGLLFLRHYLGCGAWWWVLIPLFLDYGCIPIILLALCDDIGYSSKSTSDGNEEK